MTEHPHSIFGVSAETLAERRRIEQERQNHEQQQANRREQARIERQQAETEKHLAERGRRYLEATGAEPSEATVAAWRDEYTDIKEAEHQEEQRQRHEAAVRESRIF